jgi:hypothetical protein
MQVIVHVTAWPLLPQGKVLYTFLRNRVYPMPGFVGSGNKRFHTPPGFEPQTA